MYSTFSLLQDHMYGPTSYSQPQEVSDKRRIMIKEMGSIIILSHTNTNYNEHLF